MHAKSKLASSVAMLTTVYLFTLGSPERAAGKQNLKVGKKQEEKIVIANFTPNVLT